MQTDSIPDRWWQTESPVTCSRAIFPEATSDGLWFGHVVCGRFPPNLECDLVSAELFCTPVAGWGRVMSCPHCLTGGSSLLMMAGAQGTMLCCGLIWIISPLIKHSCKAGGRRVQKASQGNILVIESSFRPVGMFSQYFCTSLITTRALLSPTKGKKKLKKKAVRGIFWLRAVSTMYTC